MKKQESGSGAGGKVLGAVNRFTAWIYSLFATSFLGRLFTSYDRLNTAAFDGFGGRFRRAWRVSGAPGGCFAAGSPVYLSPAGFSGSSGDCGICFSNVLSACTACCLQCTGCTPSCSGSCSAETRAVPM